MLASINRFTASLAGTLFNSLESLHCSSRPVHVSTSDSVDLSSSKNKDKNNEGAAYTANAGLVSTQESVSSLKVASSGKSEDGNQKNDKSSAPPKSKAGPKNDKELSQEEKQAVQELEERDREVRSHEQAHIAAGGPYVTGGASYTYQTGPDGKQYAIGGSVSIDTSSIPGNPQASLEKAQTVRKAALSPASPSAQDQKVASEAASMETKARQEIKEQKNEEEDADDRNTSENSSHYSKALDAYTTPEEQSVPGMTFSAYG